MAGREVCSPTQHNRQVLIVDDVLILCDVDPPGLLVDCVPVPAGVDGLEVGRQAVVFAGEQEVEDAQSGGLAVADVACNRQ